MSDVVLGALAASIAFGGVTIWFVSWRMGRALALVARELVGLRNQRGENEKSFIDAIQSLDLKWQGLLVGIKADVMGTVKEQIISRYEVGEIARKAAREEIWAQPEPRPRKDNRP